LWTLTYPNGQRSQLDYILINRKWRNSALNCEPYSSFATVNSDHRIVSAKIRLSLRSHKNKRNAKVKYDWKKLSNDDTIRNKYDLIVQNRFNALQTTKSESTADELYNDIITAHKEAAEQAIPKLTKKRHRIPWESETIMFKQNIVEEAHNKYTETNDIHNKDE